MPRRRHKKSSANNKPSIKPAEQQNAAHHDMPNISIPIESEEQQNAAHHDTSSASIPDKSEEQQNTSHHDISNTSTSIKSEEQQNAAHHDMPNASTPIKSEEQQTAVYPDTPNASIPIELLAFINQREELAYKILEALFPLNLTETEERRDFLLRKIVDMNFLYARQIRRNQFCSLHTFWYQVRIEHSMFEDLSDKPNFNIERYKILFGYRTAQIMMDCQLVCTRHMFPTYGLVFPVEEFFVIHMLELSLNHVLFMFSKQLLWIQREDARCNKAHEMYIRVYY